MRIPGFTAGTSLYKTSNHYRISGAFSQVSEATYPASNGRDVSQLTLSANYLQYLIPFTTPVLEGLELGSTNTKRNSFGRSPALDQCFKRCMDRCLGTGESFDYECRADCLNNCGFFPNPPPCPDGQLRCGSICCPMDTECCYSKGCCQPGEVCIGGVGCCLPSRVCNGSSCCQPGEICTPDGCSPPNQVCNGRRCKPDERCSIEGCCPAGQVVCNNHCCSPGSSCTRDGCCPSGVCCESTPCPTGKFCCGNLVCCQNGETCRTVSGTSSPGCFPPE
jgi:hypothetical protein